MFVENWQQVFLLELLPCPDFSRSWMEPRWKLEIEIPGSSMCILVLILVMASVIETEPLRRIPYNVYYPRLIKLGFQLYCLWTLLLFIPPLWWSSDTCSQLKNSMTWEVDDFIFLGCFISSCSHEIFWPCGTSLGAMAGTDCYKARHVQTSNNSFSDSSWVIFE